MAQALREAAPGLAQAQEDLRKVGLLRGQLGGSGRSGRYGLLLGRYLSSIQTVAYLSRNSPNIIGHTYVLSRELTALQDLASDPLDVMENPEEIGEALGNISEQATALEEAFEVVRRATEVDGGEDQAEREAVREVLDTVGPGIILLRHVTAGTRSLVTIAEAVETAGFLSREFGDVAGLALVQAQEELALAREEASSCF